MIPDYNRTLFTRWLTIHHWMKVEVDHISINHIFADFTYMDKVTRGHRVHGTLDPQTGMKMCHIIHKCI